MAYLRAYQMAAGDPGFLGKLVKGIGKGIGKIGKIGKFVPGLGTAISAIEIAGSIGRGLAGGPLKGIGLPPGVKLLGPGRGETFPVMHGPMPGSGGGAPQLFGPGRYGGSGGGGTSGANGRRYRRMNVGNIRALRRSMRRVNGFAKLARKTISFTSRVKMKRRKGR